MNDATDTQARPQRLITEKAALDTKAHRPDKFAIRRRLLGTLSDAERAQLKKQGEAMWQHFERLGTRTTYFRNKPVVIEAFQMTREARQSGGTWPLWLIEAMGEDRCDVGAVYPTIPDGEDLSLGTRSGQEAIYWGDWIVRSPTGELHLCSPGVFATKYESV